MYAFNYVSINVFKIFILFIHLFKYEHVWGVGGSTTLHVVHLLYLFIYLAPRF